MNTQQLAREMRQLMRSMDFISRHPALDKPGKEGRSLAKVYQQLGQAWEFLALQCQHRAGWRKLKDGRQACKICGTLKGVNERWLLLPRVRSAKSRATPARAVKLDLDAEEIALHAAISAAVARDLGR